MTVRASSAAKPRKQKRRSPITRQEGERRLIEAALDLIKTRPFSDVSVRDIAQLADVNHGFIHTWFGSKNDLLAIVAQQMSADISAEANLAPPGTEAVSIFDDRITLLVRLVIWLNLEGYSFPESVTLNIFETLRKRYEQIDGLQPDDAEVAAILATALGIGVGAFRPILEGPSNINFSKVMPVWRHILGLLAKNPSR